MHFHVTLPSGRKVKVLARDAEEAAGRIWAEHGEAYVRHFCPSKVVLVVNGHIRVEVYESLVRSQKDV
jgi:hypothetical protein